MPIAPYSIAPRSKVEILRKKRGSLITSAFGVEAAWQHLGHREIRTTSSHCVEKKKRAEIKLSTASGRLRDVAL